MDIWNELTDAFNRDMAIDEMRKKYEHTYLVLSTPEGNETVVRYNGYNDGFHQFNDEFDMHIRLKHETQYKVACKFPERCLFNHNHLALEFVRKPLRQYKRGICKDNIHIYSPVRDIWSMDGRTWTHKTIKDALFPQYPENCEEAIKLLESRSVISIALNSKFMLSLSISNNPKVFYLYYCNVLIGEFEDGCFKVKHPLFKQEIMDNMCLFKPYRIEL